MRTTVARLLLAAALLPAGPAGAQECPDPRRDLCPPGLVCGVPTTQQCSCLSCVIRSCELASSSARATAASAACARAARRMASLLGSPKAGALDPSVRDGLAANAETLAADVSTLRAQ